MNDITPGRVVPRDGWLLSAVEGRQHYMRAGVSLCGHYVCLDDGKAGSPARGVVSCNPCLDLWLRDAMLSGAAQFGLTVPCPLHTCAAPAGVPCCVAGGHPGLHATRVFVARRAGRQAALAEGARRKFAIGQRVRLTEAGAKALLGDGTDRRRGRMARTGVVLGFGRAPQLVGVRPDGARMRRQFHMDYWEPWGLPSDIGEGRS